jgi:hypothetical protein
MSAAVHPTEALLSLVYGELSEDESNRVQAHLQACPACAATVASYRAVRRASAALPREIASEKGLDSLLHYGAQAAARARRTRTLRWVGSLVGAAAAAGLVLLLALPQRPPEAPVASTSAPSAVGPLAQNEVRPLAKAQAPELPESTATLRRAPSTPPSRFAPQKASGEEKAEALKAAKQAPSAAEGALASRETARGNVQPTEPSASVSKPVALAAEAHGAAGAAAQRSAPRAVANAPAAADNLDAAAAAPTLKRADAELSQREVDERRRGLLLQTLPHAPAAQRLPLLAELCGLEARLGRRAEAKETCSQVVQGYPGTPEAAAAQRTLEGL